MNKVHTATQIVSEIDVAKYCFENSVAKSMLPYQGDILTRLLKKQIAFIHKYTSNPRKMAIFENSPYSDIFEVVTEVIAIVKSFSLSLDVALCMDAEKEADKIIQEGEMLLDAEPTPAKSVHETLSECDCNNQLCLNPSCTANCKRICYQTYSLSRWTCKPAKGGAVGVALDDLCNGKTDCYDETDESNCFSRESTLCAFVCNVYVSNLQSNIIHSYMPIWNLSIILSHLNRIVSLGVHISLQSTIPTDVILLLYYVVFINDNIMNNVVREWCER